MVGLKSKKGGIRDISYMKRKESTVHWTNITVTYWYCQWKRKFWVKWDDTTAVNALCMYVLLIHLLYMCRLFLLTFIISSPSWFSSTISCSLIISTNYHLNLIFKRFLIFNYIYPLIWSFPVINNMFLRPLLITLSHN